MTKQELINLHQLLCYQHTSSVAFKIAEGHGLTNVELLKLIWCKLNVRGRHINFKRYTLMKLRHKYINGHAWKIWPIGYRDGTEDIPWPQSHVFEALVRYLIRDSIL